MNEKMKKIVAYGGCNTLGYREYEKKSWPEKLGEKMGADVTNLGHAMASTREFLRFAEDYPPSDFDVAFVQYGGVDSWLTFRYSPYVLYYPHGALRKIARKIVKKLKKYARKLRVHSVLGWENVVPLDEYIANIEGAILSAKETVFVLVAIPPNHDESRDPRIRQYNEALEQLAMKHDNAAFANTYDVLSRHMGTAYMDKTHLNGEGIELVAACIWQVLSQGKYNQ